MGKAFQGGLSLFDPRGIADGGQIFFDGFMIRFPDVVQDVSGFVSPTPLGRDTRIDEGQSSQQSLSAIRHDQLQTFCPQPSFVQIGQEGIPCGLRLPVGDRKVDDLLLPLLGHSQSDQNHPLDRPDPCLALQTTPSRKRNRYDRRIGRRWNAETATSRILDTRLTVVALTASPSTGIRE